MENLEKIVSSFFDKNNIAVNIEKYYDGTQMLKEEKHFDLILWISKCRIQTVFPLVWKYANR